jgi:hypothetical protein
MKRSDIITNEETNEATYCPEDDKIRLYVGRVPREEYEFLRAEGWTSTPKQSCDFVAVWTPSREATALQYAATIGDEDQDPADRAADRAERFSGYRDKRADEATGHADRYDSQPTAHGFQNERKAEKAAARHDRIADKATDQWSKAEYWQRRTAGVISHALHKSSPEVRMGRIKVLEAELRKNEKDHEEYAHKYRKIEKWAANPAAIVEAIANRFYGGNLEKGAEAVCDEIAGCGKHKNPAAPEGEPAYYFEHMKSEHPPTVADYAAHYLKTHYAPDVQPRPWKNHLELRLAYENQMLEAQGGRAAFVEMIPGGFVGSHQITKVTKSPATGRVVSVEVECMSDSNQYGRPWSDGKGARLIKQLINIERMGSDIYRAPTDEELAAYNAKTASAKKAKASAAKEKAAKGENCPLINPTDEDAERLQAMINEQYLADWTRRNGQPTSYHKPKPPAQVQRITQAVYSANSSGSYAKAETRGLCANGVLEDRFSNLWTSAAQARAKARGPALCKIRVTGYEPEIVLIITDKPQKALSAKVWAAHVAPVVEESTQELKAA